MSRMIGAATARLRLALTIVVGGAFAILTPALSAATLDAPSAAVLAAVAVAVTALIGANGLVATQLPRTPATQPPATDEMPRFLAARVTDPLHHPLRPRAPGLA